MSEGKKQVIAHIPFEDYKKLRLILFEEEKTLSGWVREKAKEEIVRHEQDNI